MGYSWSGVRPSVRRPSVHIQIILNNVYEMKAWSFIVLSAEVQSNWLMDINTAKE